MGRLTRDPELRHTQNQNVPVASFTLACNRDYSTNGQNEADFIDIVAWKKTAEFVGKHFRKGQLVAVQGRIQSRKWQDTDGKNRVAIEVVAEKVHFAEKKAGSAAPQTTGPGNMSAYTAPDPSSGFVDIEDDDGELPF